MKLLIVCIACALITLSFAENNKTNLKKQWAVPTGDRLDAAGYVRHPMPGLINSNRLGHLQLPDGPGTYEFSSSNTSTVAQVGGYPKSAQIACTFSFN
jgi:hypothetical protein